MFKAFSFMGDCTAGCFLVIRELEDGSSSRLSESRVRRFSGRSAHFLLFLQVLARWVAWVDRYEFADKQVIGFGNKVTSTEMEMVQWWHWYSNGRLGILQTGLKRNRIVRMDFMEGNRLIGVGP
ncbi:hypothetical protein V6N13_051319 [Hibiscus sabdariffa]|uniref:Uncharacterized protein n=1 Tax=Hibiscus sabdariffa TaxID=183260 RepID=A0ABR2T451_9ROSI